MLAQAVMLLACACEVPGSNFFWDIDYPGWGFSCERKNKKQTP
jgi:hypothetical protein